MEKKKKENETGERARKKNIKILFPSRERLVVK
jgi:hypothetical protein